MSRSLIVVAVVLSVVAVGALLVGAAMYGIAAGNCEDER